MHNRVMAEELMRVSAELTSDYLVDPQRPG